MRRWMVVSTVAVLALVPSTAWAAGNDHASDRPTLSRVQAERFDRWWDVQATVEAPFLVDLPIGALQDSAAQATALGVSKDRLSSALFSEVAEDLFAPNSAGGEGKPSPYLRYFRNNPIQLGALGDFFHENPAYVVGPDGTQERLFAEFDGLRDSYLASLGLMEVNGRIVDPRAPYLTPYLASMFLGAPQPLPQPETSLNVGLG